MSNTRFQTLDEWLSWQETLHPTAIELKLERIREVAQRLKVERPNARVITVAGTNGKGSCVATLVQLLTHLGYRVGAYTSPHIEHYNERIGIERVPATDEAICRAFQAIDDARQDISLTYFEFGTLAAFYLFQEAQLDFWVLEVGLGGRLDATNVIDADLAVITPIALDHCDWLGDTREAIAVEKAGICRAGKPVVVADGDPPQNLQRVLDDLQASATFIGKDFTAQLEKQTAVCQFQEGIQLRFEPHLPLPSMAAAIQTLLVLGAVNRDTLEAPHFVEALNAVRLAGRLQEIEYEGRMVILDVAHNPAAVAYLVRALKNRGQQKVRVVFAAMRDKDYAVMLRSLTKISSHFYYCALPEFPRAAPPEIFTEVVSGRCFASVRDALQAALADTAEGPTEAVLVAGSFYTVAAATDYLQSLASEPVA